jgi:O-antigen ligase
MFAVFAIAIIKGLASGYSLQSIFSDFNGYIYFALIGLFSISNLELKKILQILFAGSLVTGLKTIIILFIFSHGWTVIGSPLIYHWIRDTGVGEITLISHPLFRVFFQSHFYNLLALIFGGLILLTDRVKIKSIWLRWGLWILTWLNFFVIIISQSRSFWVAGLLTLVVFVPLSAFYFKVPWQRVAIFLLLIPVFVIISNFAGQIIIGDFQTNFITGRVGSIAGSAGISSRLAQLQPAIALIEQAPLLGHGFGTTVRYRSDDPRIKNQSNPEGWTDAPQLEWGYLDLAVKAGLVGLALYLLFLGYLIWRLLSLTKAGSLLSSDLLLGLITLMIIHIFTPYLNHPLGIGFVLVVFALCQLLRKRKPPALADGKLKILNLFCNHRKT